MSASSWFCVSPGYQAAGNQRFDFLGAGTLLSSLLPVAGANDRATQWVRAGTDPRAPGGVVGFAGIFILVESRVTQPMIDLGCSVMRFLDQPDCRIHCLRGDRWRVRADAILSCKMYWDLHHEWWVCYRRLSNRTRLTAPDPGDCRTASAQGTSWRRSVRVDVRILRHQHTTMGTTNPRVHPPPDTDRHGMGLFEPPYASLIMGSVPPARFGVAAGLLHIAMAWATRWVSLCSALCGRPVSPHGWTDCRKAGRQCAGRDPDGGAQRYLSHCDVSHRTGVKPGRVNLIRSGRGRRHSTPAGQRTASGASWRNQHACRQRPVKKPTTRCSYSSGWVSNAAICPVADGSHSVRGSPAAAK